MTKLHEENIQWEDKCLKIADVVQLHLCSFNT
jgi:hypothetical protein